MTSSIRDNHYSETGFWSKVGSVAKAAGAKVIETALLLYFTLQSPNCPAWARATIIGALGYFIFPIDAIPDVLVPVGYTDDAAVLAAALASVAVHVGPEEKAKTAEKMRDWFG